VNKYRVHLLTLSKLDENTYQLSSSLHY